MTVDEILASGRYVDRRGREWERGPSFVRNRDWFTWVHPLKRKVANDEEMRLLIERDQHVCPGLALCRTHPVPFVILWPLPTAIPARATIGRTCRTHGEAFTEGQRMAVTA